MLIYLTLSRSLGGESTADGTGTFHRDRRSTSRTPPVGSTLSPVVDHTTVLRTVNYTYYVPVFCQLYIY